ncbi:unnamed protein product, partial [Mesorhabditis spiculigera]
MDARVRLFQGLPTDTDIEALQGPHFIVIDDQSDRRLTANLSFLKRLQAAKNMRRILRKASYDQLGCLIESMYNVKAGNVPLHKYEIRKLKRHVDTIDHLSRQRQEEAARRGLVQTGDGQDFCSMFRKMRLVPYSQQGSGQPFTRFTQDDVDKQRLLDLDKRRTVDAGVTVPEKELNKIVAHLNTPEDKRGKDPPFLVDVLDAVKIANPASPLFAQYSTPLLNRNGVDETYDDLEATPRPSHKRKLFTPKSYSKH